MKNILWTVLLAVVAWYGWGNYQDRVTARREAEMANPASKQKARAAAALKNTDSGVSFFTCDGRSTCSQMTSCEEAKYFIKTCPGFTSGVFGEEASCEKQWCKK